MLDKDGRVGDGQVDTNTSDVRCQQKNIDWRIVVQTKKQSELNIKLSLFSVHTKIMLSSVILCIIINKNTNSYE
jgi:hypothetical protein